MTSPPPEAMPLPRDSTSKPSLEQPSHGPRRSSFNFLGRAKSTERLSERKSSGGRARKAREAALREEELRRQRESIPQQPPRLPDVQRPPEMQTFGGDERPDSVAIISGHIGNGHYVNTSAPPAKPVRQAPNGKSAIGNNAIANNARGGSAPPTSIPRPPDFDPYARTESMTHRGRYSYASSAVSTVNSPRRVRRRKDPTPYNVLVIGARNSGKTSFINFLRSSLALPPNKRPTRSPEELQEMLRNSTTHANFTSHYLETEIDGERVGLTIWDSPGLEKSVVDLQMKDLQTFIESKFEETFTEEQKVMRAPGILDTHIHCTFMVFDPVRLDSNIALSERSIANGYINGKITDAARITGGLDDELDLQVLRMLQGKTTVVPVVSKADTVTSLHMEYLKKTVFESLKKAGVEPLEALIGEEETEEEEEEENSGVFDERDEDEDAKSEHDNPEVRIEDESAEARNIDEAPATPTSPSASKLSPPPSASVKRRHSRRISTGSASVQSSDANESNEKPIIPFSILSPDPHTLTSDYKGPPGRKFPWGFADPYDTEHCDFGKLKECVFSEWRAELREASREIWYERWRTSRLHRVGGSPSAGNAGYRQAPRGGRGGNRNKLIP